MSPTKSDEVSNFFLAAEKFLHIKPFDTPTVRGAEVEVETTLRDYQEVQGVVFPFSIDQRAVAGEQGVSKTSFPKVELNVLADDLVFSKSADLAPFQAAQEPGSNTVGEEAKNQNTGQYRTAKLLRIDDATDLPDTTQKAGFLLLIQDGPYQYVASYKVSLFRHVHGELEAGRDAEYRVSEKPVLEKTPDGEETKARLRDRVGAGALCGNVASSPGPSAP